VKFNSKVDRYFVIPAVAAYFILVPEKSRREGLHSAVRQTNP
jgi:ABC-type transporter lipoprotein component MlaA